MRLEEGTFLIKNNYLISPVFFLVLVRVLAHIR